MVRPLVRWPESGGCLTGTRPTNDPQQFPTQCLIQIAASPPPPRGLAPAPAPGHHTPVEVVSLVQRPSAVSPRVAAHSRGVTLLLPPAQGVSEGGG